MELRLQLPQVSSAFLQNPTGFRCNKCCSRLPGLLCNLVDVAQPHRVLTELIEPGIAGLQSPNLKLFHKTAMHAYEPVGIF